MQIVATRTLTSRLAAPVLVATTASTTQINLTWTAPAANGQSVIAGRRLYRATSAAGPWTQIASSGTSASATGLTTGTPYYFYVEYYDQYQTGLPSNIASATPQSAAVLKKFHPGWGVLLDGFITDPAKEAGFMTQIDELGTMPNVTVVKMLAYWGGLAQGTTAGNVSFNQGLDLLGRFYTRCAAAGKYMYLSPFPIAFGGGNFHNGSIFPQYISENPTTYGITVPLSYGSGAMARTWRSSVTDELLRLHEAIADQFDGLPFFEGIQTEETSINVVEGVDGYSWAAYETQLLRQIATLAQQFPRSQLRTSTNFAGGGDPAMQRIIAACVANAVGCGGPDVLPKETIPSNRIWCGYTGGIDYRGVSRSRTPWYSEIQLPSMGSGKEGDFTMDQLYNAATAGIAYAHKVGGGGAVINLPGHTGFPMRPSYIVITRNNTPATAPSTYRLMWGADIKPFINSHVGYGPGGNLYPTDLPQ